MMDRCVRRFSILALLSLAASTAGWAQSTTPPTVAVRLLFEGPGEQTISGTPTLQIKPHVTYRITNTDGLYWTIPAYWQTIDVTSTTGAQIIAMHPNTINGSSYTISPETYYDYQYTDATGTYRGRVQVPCCTDTEWGEIHIDDDVDGTSNYLLQTDIIAGQGVEVGQEGGSVRITNTASGFAASNVLEGRGIDVGTEGSSVRVTTDMSEIADDLDGTGLYRGADHKLHTDSETVTSTAYDAHVANTSNPHGATATPGASVIVKSDADSKIGAGWLDDADIDHNSTGGLDTGDYRHLTAAEKADLTDTEQSGAHYHDADRARANHTGTQTKSTISDFAHSSTHSDGTDNLAVDQGVQIASGRVRAKVGTGVYVGADHGLYTDSEAVTSTTDRARANHTGTQARSTISDFSHGSTHADGTDPIPVDQGIIIQDGRYRLNPGTTVYIGADHKLYVDSANTTIASMGGDITGPSDDVTVRRVHDFAFTYPTSHQAMGDNYVWAWDYSTQTFVLEAQGGGLTGQIAGASDTAIDTLNTSIDGPIQGSISGDTMTISGTAGKDLQTVYAESYAVDSTTSVIPGDDTLPQSSEGKEITWDSGTTTITPRNINNVLCIRVELLTSNGSTFSTVAALFKDSETNARAVGYVGEDNSGGYVNPIQIHYHYTVVQAGAITWKVRYGPNTASTATLNGYGGTNRLFNTAIKTTIEIKELYPNETVP